MTARHILTCSWTVLAGWLMVTEWGIILCQKETDPPLGLGPKTRNINIYEVTSCQAREMVVETPSGKANMLEFKIFCIFNILGNFSFLALTAKRRGCHLLAHFPNICFSNFLSFYTKKSLNMYVFFSIKILLRKLQIFPVHHITVVLTYKLKYLGLLS